MPVEQSTSGTGSRKAYRIRLLVTATIAAALMTNPYSAVASLGGTADTVEADRARMQAELHTTKKDNYSIHELRAPNSVVVREFISPTGIVFGVAWQGPSRPDLRQLLGGYFNHFIEAAQAQKKQTGNRRLMRVDEPDLFVRSGGHARAFVGKAYLPQLLPAGVQAEEIQ